MNIVSYWFKVFFTSDELIFIIGVARNPTNLCMAAFRGISQARACYTQSV